jgi:hypothetical protein
MAIDESLSSLLTPKQRLQLEELQSLLAKAEADKDEPTPIADAVKAADRFAQSFSIESLSDSFKKMKGGQKAATEFATDAIQRIEALAEALRPQVEVTDRAAGNLVASNVANILKGNGYEDDVVPFATDLVDRWAAVRGSSPRGEGSTNFPDLGFRAYTVCQVEGCKDPRTGKPWQQWHGKKNPNSLRHYAVKHAREAHSIEMSPKYAGDSVKYGALTAAVNAVMDGEETKVVAADYSVEKRAS